MPLHPDVRAYLIESLAAFGSTPLRVAELGSYVMHGHDPRVLFPGSEYVGVDARQGPGVDVVGIAHEWSRWAPPVDCVLSLQALEHDPHWTETLEGAVCLLRRGGLLVVTCAGPGWVTHDTDASPEPGWYRNVSAEEILHVARREAVRLGLTWSHEDARTVSRRSCVRVVFTRPT